MKKEKNKQLRLDEVRINAIAIAPILIGLIILIVLQVYEGQYVADSNTTLPRMYIYVVQPILSNTGITLIVLGIGSICIEVYGYTSYFRKRISEVFTELDMLSILDRDYKIKLRSNLLTDIYNPNSVDAEEIVQLFDNKIEAIISGLYFQEFDMYIDCALFTHADGEIYIKKDICRKYVLNEINKTENNYLDKLLTINYKEISDIEDVCIVKSVKVNDKTLCAGTDYEVLVNDNPTGGKYEKHFECVLVNKRSVDTTVMVEVKYSTIVPLLDNISIRINYLCKSFKINVTLSDPSYKAIATGFKFSTESNKFDISENASMTVVDSRGWLLPGEGAVISFLKQGLTL